MNLLETLIVTAIFFGITLFVHIFICRLGSAGNFMLKGVFLGCISTTGYAAYMVYMRQFDITGLYILFTIWLFYLMVLINLLNSVTLKMLASLYGIPSGTLSAQDFGNTFNTEDGFETRLAMLHSSKLIQQQGTVITLTSKGRYLLMIVHQVKAVLSIG
jgi:hypothetical protein